jgi:predicted transcriptional regulator
MKFNTSGEGLITLFKPYQAALMEHIWELNNPDRVGITSGQAHKYLQKHPDSKSRASVIFFLDDMVEEGVLSYEEETGKGGYHRVYYPEMNRKQFAKYVVETITRKLAETFPSSQ